MDELPAPTDTLAIDRDCADAYAEFWQCVDADELSEPGHTVDPKQSAYEQYWCLIDAD